MKRIDGIEFDEKNHIYRVNGIVIPSVSEIIRPLSADAYGKIPRDVLAAAASKGTEVHEAIENFNVFGVVEDIEHYEYLNAYIDWYSSTKPEVIASEYRIYHPLMLYAGTADLICKINGSVSLVDFKTSRNVIDKTYRVQLEAYRLALERNGINIDRKFVLHLTGDGLYEEIDYDVDDVSARSVFYALKTVHDYIKN